MSNFVNKVGPHGETKGRIVHYADHSVLSNKDELLAAVIVKVNEDGTVNLTVFNEERGEPAIGPISNVRFSETYQRHCWSWPPRVEDPRGR